MTLGTSEPTANGTACTDPGGTAAIDLRGRRDRKGDNVGRYLNSERRRLRRWKETTPYLSEKAREPGMYRGKPREFCLPKMCAEQNLYSGIRLLALGYFAAYEIKWHDGRRCRCSNHLCDSMVSCVNCLFPFAERPDALAALLQPVFPSIARVMPMERSGLWLAIEWIGLENYLGEVKRGDRDRTRGANFTSLDAAVRFEDTSGRTQIALIEWKYTESYAHSSKAEGKSGARRQAVYRDLVEAADGPVDTGRLPGYLHLFYEPFYQMMRQQLLAHEMEKNRELGAEVVTVVHVCPRRNTDFQRITSPGLTPLGESSTEVWKSLLRRPDRFVEVHTEDLFRSFDATAFPDLLDWRDYVADRYHF